LTNRNISQGEKMTAILKSQHNQFKDNDWDQLNYEFFQNFESRHTRKCYQRDIQLFFSFLDNHKIYLNNLKSILRSHVVAYRNHLQAIEQAPKTICRKLSSLSSYFDFLLEKNIVEINPCYGLRRPRQVVVNETQDLSDDNVQKLFEALFNEENSKSIKLHRAVIFLLFSTGIRKSELINLKFKDYVQINESTFCLKVKAKGGKYLTKVIHPSAKAILDDYLQDQIDQGELTSGEEYLLRPSRNPLNPKQLNKPLNPKTIDYILGKYCQKAGIYQKVSPHSARATYIGSALENGVDLWRVSLDVGHESVRTTEIYNKRRAGVKNSPVHSLGFFNNYKKTA